MGELVRFSITGSDGAGKDSAVHTVAHKLSELASGPVVKVTRPNFRIPEGGVATPAFPRLLKVVDALHALADKTQKRAFVLGTNAANVMLQTRIIEPYEIRRHTQGEGFLLAARHMVIDPAVYATYYSQRLSKRSPNDRIDFFVRLTHNPPRDALFLLTVDPVKAVERIEDRIAAESAGKPTDREKWRHMHENPTDLAALSEEYFRVIAAYRDRWPIPVIQIDTNQRSRKEVAEIVTESIGDLREHKIKPNEWILV